MKPHKLIVADPISSAAQLIVEQCRRLADSCIAVVTIDELMLAAGEMPPDILVFSLELAKSRPEERVKQVRQIVPGALLIATFRELTLPGMEKNRKAGVDEFIPQPVDPTDIFRAVSLRFGTAVRQHERLSVTIDVLRADGEILGRTVNVSEGGMCIDAVRPLTPGLSLLVCLSLPPAPQTLVGVRFRVLSVEGTPAMRTRGCFESLRGENHRRLAAFLNRLRDAKDIK